MGLFARRAKELPTPENALPGREQTMPVPATHAVLKNPLRGPWPEGYRVAVFGLGCFWGAEQEFWRLEGVYSTAAGYAGGSTPNPTYDEVCSGHTGHTEVVQVVYDPERITYRDLLKVFWESHDPTQGMRQGNDVGTQYRSAVYVTGDDQLADVEATRGAFAENLAKAGYGPVTTDIAPLREFYYAEDYHQQYLFKVPNGYCPVHSTGVSYPATAEGADAG